MTSVHTFSLTCTTRTFIPVPHVSVLKNREIRQTQISSRIVAQICTASTHGS